MTPRIISPNLLLRAQNLKVNPRSFELDINASQACYGYKLDKEDSELDSSITLISKEKKSEEA